MDFSQAVEWIRVTLEIIALLFLPIIVWLLRSVVQHDRRFLLLEERVNDSLTGRLRKLEDKNDTIEIKINKINENSVYTMSKIDSIERVTTDIRDTLVDKRIK